MFGFTIDRQLIDTRTGTAKLAGSILALIYVGSAAVIAVAAGAPITDRASVSAFIACAIVLTLGGLAILLAARRLGRRMLLLGAALRVVVSVFMACVAPTAGDTFIAVGAFIWVALWAAAFLGGRAVLGVIAIEVSGVVLATAINPDHLRTLVELGSITSASAVGASVLGSVLEGLRRQVHGDHLTGLLNRCGVEERLAQRTWRGRADAAPSLVLIDLDGFKAVNDREGHAAGDALLSAFARELDEAASEQWLTARVGGDEFIVIVPGASAEEAHAWAMRVRAVSCVPWSFGVAQRQAGEPLAPWLARADRLMYEAKQQRRATQHLDHVLAR